MEKVTLKLLEFLQLEIELNGAEGVPGIMSEKMPLTTKYLLHDLSKKVISEVELITKLRNDLVTKYGTDEGKGITIEHYISVGEGKITNPAYIKFVDDFNKLMNEEKELEYKPFKLEDFSEITSTSTPEILFKLIQC